MLIEDGQFRFTRKERIVFGADCVAINRKLTNELVLRNWLNGGGDPDLSAEAHYQDDLDELAARRRTCEARITRLSERADDLRRRAALPQYNHLNERRIK